MILFPWRLGWSTPYRHGSWIFNRPTPKPSLRPFPGQSGASWAHSRMAQSTLFRAALSPNLLHESVEVSKDPRALHFACAGSLVRYHFLSPAQKRGLNQSTAPGWRRMDVSRWCSTLTAYAWLREKQRVGVRLSPAPATVGRIHNLLQPVRPFAYRAAVGGLQVFQGIRNTEGKRQLQQRRRQQVQRLLQQIPYQQAPMPAGGYFMAASFGQVAPPFQDRWPPDALYKPVTYQNQEDPGFLNTIDIYLLGGEEQKGADSTEYHACNWNGSEDSGNCSIYKVRWSYRYNEVTHAERVLANSLEPTNGEAYTYNHPGLSPTGRYLSFGSIRPGQPKLKNAEILDLQSREQIVAATPVPTSSDPVWSDFSRGAAAMGVIWYNQNYLLWTNGAEYTTQDRQGEEITCEAGSMSGASFHRDPMQVGTQHVVRGPLAYQGRINYSIRNQMIPFQQVQDPKAHPAVKTKAGFLMGPRVAVMGGKGICEPAGGAIESGFVISLEDEDLFEEVEIPLDGSGNPDGSMQHCSFNYAGDTLQCTRQQTGENIENAHGYNVLTKALYKFQWNNGQSLQVGNSGRAAYWKSQGYLFTPDVDQLNAKFPHAFPPFDDKDDSSRPQCRSLTYKAASWCGHDDWMIVPTFCSDDRWAAGVWADELDENGGEKLDNGEPINHMLTIVCRLLMVHLPTGEVWDLTDGLAKFGLAPDAALLPDGTVTTFSTWHGTCGAPFVKASRWTWGIP